MGEVITWMDAAHRQAVGRLQAHCASPDARLVISGVNGWIGCAICNMLLDIDPGFWASRLYLLGSRPGVFSSSQGYRLPIMVLADPENRSRLRGKRTIVFHLAFLTKDRVPDNEPDGYFLANAAIRNAMFHSLADSTCDNFILASSGAVYDAINPGQDPRQAKVGVYGKAKWDDEQATLLHFSGGPTRVHIPRIFNISGPFSNKPELYALSSFIIGALGGKEVRVKSPNLVYRSYTCLIDLLSLLFNLISTAAEVPGAVFDSTCLPEIESADLASKVIRTLGSPATLVLDHPARQTIDRYLGSTGDMLGLLTRYDQVPLELDMQIKRMAWHIQRCSR